ncbi:MAG: thioredoxin TrxC [Candidatus Lernaella stagnicola]|nr:thioredoxin TrxC [Candidatus Lernaella stagnicola]
MAELIRCEQCGTMNRAPLAALENEKARCGKCKTALAMPSQPIDTDDRRFHDDVLESELPVLVDFWAPWCGPCKMMAPVLRQLAAKHAGRIKVVKLNTEENPRAAAPYDIRSIPAMLLFKQGRVVHQVIGARPLAALEQELLPQL